MVYHHDVKTEGHTPVAHLQASIPGHTVPREEARHISCKLIQLDVLARSTTLFPKFKHGELLEKGTPNSCQNKKLKKLSQGQHKERKKEEGRKTVKKEKKAKEKEKKKETLLARRERKEANKGVYFIYVQYIIYVCVILIYKHMYIHVHVYMNRYMYNIYS